MANMKKNIKELEEELKKKTGEDKLPKEEIIKTKNNFNSSTFLKLAKEVKKIFVEDERYTNSAIKPV